MRKRINFSIFILFTVLYSFLLYSQETITILHTNDIHGSYLPRLSKKTDAGKEKSEYGGILALNYYVQQVKQEVGANYLLLDGGDFMTGNPICDIEYEGVKGGALVYFLNYIGYHGSTLGNHEFDLSIENCRGLIRHSQFPVMSANLLTAEGQLFAPEAYHIYTRGNLKIGVIGIIVHDLADLLNGKQQQQVHSVPALEVVEAIASQIDAETDLIIVLSHSGIEIDELLAQQLSSKVDIIVGAHSHSKLDTLKNVNGKIIAQAASNLAYLGRIDVAVAADTVQAYNGRLIFLDAAKVVPDTVLKKDVDKYTAIINEQYGKVIGYLKTPWKRNSSGESNIGNFIADCIREFAGADFALINSGGIRKGMPKGEIKKMDIKEILPFDNQICIFPVTGVQLLTIIKSNASAVAKDSHGNLQVSGIKYRYKLNSSGEPMIIDATIGGRSIEPDKIYQGATIDYLIANDDKYLGMNVEKFENRFTPIADIIINAIEQKKVINSKIEKRIVKE